jgi:transcriptional regulator with XRE-family HTH domain
MTRPHGTYAKYRKEGCRCVPCTRANARASKVYRLRTGADRNGIPAVPLSVPGERVRAHLAALTASGWTRAAIAAETGITPNRVGELIRGYHASWVQQPTADRLFALAPYDTVDVDDVVVDRLIAGADWRDLAATRAERIAAAERAWAMWGPARLAAKAQGTSDQALPGESLTSLEDRLGLRAGRDFSRLVRVDVAS